MSSDASAAAGASAAPIVASLRSDANAMALLHESNLGEIAAGQRAVREASDSAVRAFAQQMVSEHTALDAQGMALGQKLGVTPALPDSQLPQLQQSELQALPSGGAGAGAGAGAASSSSSPNTSGSMTGGVGATGAGTTGAPSSTGTTGTSGTAGGMGSTGSTSPSSTASTGTAGMGTGSGSSASGSTTGGVGATGVQAGATTGPDSLRRSTGATSGSTSGMSGMSGMSSASGTGSAPSAFDRAYIAQQVTAHQRTLALVDAAIARSSQAELKSSLQSQVRPAVAQHLQMAQQIQSRIGNQ